MEKMLGESCLPGRRLWVVDLVHKRALHFRIREEEQGQSTEQDI